jgi:hypothetical protein
MLFDGTEVTYDQIKEAFEAGDARLVHGRGLNKTTACLAIDGQDFDTRGECVSMYEEAWTMEPKTLNEALKAAAWIHN